MTLHLYLDEDAMDHDLLRALLARGVDVTTALQAGMIEREDSEHLDYATAQGRVLYSFNVADFFSSAQSVPGWGQVPCRSGPGSATAVLRGRANAPPSEADHRHVGRGNEKSGRVSQCLGLMCAQRCSVPRFPLVLPWSVVSRPVVVPLTFHFSRFTSPLFPHLVSVSPCPRVARSRCHASPCLSPSVLCFLPSAFCLAPPPPCSPPLLRGLRITNIGAAPLWSPHGGESFG